MAHRAQAVTSLHSSMKVVHWHHNGTAASISTNTQRVARIHVNISSPVPAAMFWKTCKRDVTVKGEAGVGPAPIDKAPEPSGPASRTAPNSNLRTLPTMKSPQRLPPPGSSASSTSTVTATSSTAAAVAEAALQQVVPVGAPTTQAPLPTPAAGTQGRLKLQMSVSYLPHPSKASYGGEDAHFLSEVRGGAIGVADGVGGWQESGINPAEYSRSLMRVACAYLEGRDPYEVAPRAASLPRKQHVPKSLRKAIKSQQEAGDSRKERRSGEFPLKEGGIDPQGALHVAHTLTRLPGSSTALVLQLDDTTGQLHAANLGDSGFMVVRNGSVVLQSRPLEHYFDCPHQFGAYPDFVDTTDTAEGADKYVFGLQQGDVIVAGTDGLWDNCFVPQILEQLPVDVSDVDESARRIASLARRQAQDAGFESPYILECQQQGYDLPIWEKVIGAKFVDGRLQLKKLTGGKIDDITVIVAMADMAPAAQPPPQAADAAGSQVAAGAAGGWGAADGSPLQMLGMLGASGSLSIPTPRGGNGLTPRGSASPFGGAPAAASPFGPYGMDALGRSPSGSALGRSPSSNSLLSQYSPTAQHHLTGGQAQTAVSSLFAPHAAPQLAPQQQQLLPRSGSSGSLSGRDGSTHSAHPGQSAAGGGLAALAARGAPDFSAAAVVPVQRRGGSPGSAQDKQDKLGERAERVVQVRALGGGAQPQWAPAF